LKEKPNAKITLTGCNDGLPGYEKGNLGLSRSRAETVQKYLADSWKIAPERIMLKARELPEYATSSVDTLEGAEENRRVEITSNDPSVLEPLLVFDTLAVAEVPKIRVRMKGVAEAGFEQSIMKAFQATEKGPKKLKEVIMNGAPDAVYDWNVKDEPATMPRAEGELSFELELRDKAGQTYIPESAVPVDQLSIKKKKAQGIKDKSVDVFRLISFPFNSTQMGKLNEETVKKYINPYLTGESKVVATGYTDKLGKEEVNQKLSDGRAGSVAKSLKAGKVSSLGVGNRRPLYSNDLPEGRFYNRTVEVRVETPVDYAK
jgi:outer membrane protein OmpA-like peptidoglycan-associated protein